MKGGNPYYFRLVEFRSMVEYNQQFAAAGKYHLGFLCPFYREEESSFKMGLGYGSIFPAFTRAAAVFTVRPAV